jgi:porin
MTKRCLIALLAAMLACSRPDNAVADDAPPKPTGFWERDTLTGNWGGLRDRWANQGITPGLLEQSELWANLDGGRRTGVVYDGLTTLSLKLDLDKIAGWTGATFFVSAFQIHGRGPSINLVGNLQTVSNIEATRSNKLYNIWIEQVVLDGKLNVRVGQEGANDEMMLSRLGAMFVDSSFGYPALLAFDLPSGGPNYPIAAPMVRAQYKLTDRFTLVGAAFDGDPAGPGTNDPQIRDYTGTAFRLRDGVLAFAELWYSAGSDGVDGLPGTYKIGSWYHSGRFTDPLHDTTGRSLASPLSNGIARSYRGDQAFYAVFDQMVWRPSGSKDRGLGLFGLAMTAPDDRNFTSVFLEGGLNWTGPFDGREQDVLGLAFAYLNLGSAIRKFGADQVRFGAATTGLNSHETIIELTYQYQVTPWWALQPDLQYVINPGVGQTTVNGAPLKNAVVAGVRASITF